MCSPPVGNLKYEGSLWQAFLLLCLRIIGKHYSLGRKDLEFLSTYLFENETPLTEKELVPVLVEERIRGEREAACQTAALDW